MCCDEKKNTPDINKFEDLEKVLKEFDKKIKKSIHNTNPQERDDLEQEIKMKIMEKVSNFIDEAHTPGFWKFISEFEKNI
ncbi:helix-turn-helix domain-containing protein [Ornithinibacillus contaminans]|uniref:helix-turn-helix domain-containing protein n=1 Tax=Ornithinibacillus contaminans TaxID=694055 RepID=UPI00064E0A5D|nr:helix-turn-helix domain-containing protein [Ornithinibacillus contaminans]